LKKCTKCGKKSVQISLNSIAPNVRGFGEVAEPEAK